MVVYIDAARVSNPGVVFSYRNNPNVTTVFPSNTISSGGIKLTFTGVNLDVVQQSVLEVYQPMGAPPATTEQHHVIFDFFVNKIFAVSILQRATSSTYQKYVS